MGDIITHILQNGTILQYGSTETSFHTPKFDLSHFLYHLKKLLLPPLIVSRIFKEFSLAAV